MRCEASFCYRGNAEGVFEVTLTKTEWIIVKSQNMSQIWQKIMIMTQQGLIPDKILTQRIAFCKFFSNLIELSLYLFTKYTIMYVELRRIEYIVVYLFFCDFWRRGFAAFYI